jgi:hypothetical protein
LNAVYSNYPAQGKALAVTVLTFVLVGCAGVQSSSSQESLPAAETVDTVGPESIDVPADESQDAFIDRKRQVVTSVVDNTALWFDGLFATSEIESKDASASGRVLLGSRWDERDGLKKRVRFSARVSLPALRNRTRLVLGRSDTDDLVEGSESTEIKVVPDKFNDHEDEDWFLGLGYRQRTGLASGFDAGIGVTFASGAIQPYVQANYRWNKTLGDGWLLRMRPRVFWRDDRGVGSSLTTILDYFVSDDWLLRSWNVLVSERETEGVRWTNKLLAYQSLGGRSAFSYSLFVTGQTDAEVDVDDYGFEVRFRRRFLREWMFLELSTGISWPREFRIESRERNFAVGADIEMRFGEGR